ncbi:hypothetical protein FRC08_013110 [Ceratobasidium sp. 394]|nr:hypothetical protein FRC08_013110 [Ceratobasidium sp. 394]
MVTTRGQLAALAAVVALMPQSALAVPQWGQCGGIGWTGGTTCDSPYVCTVINDWYYQCLTAGSGTTPGGGGPTRTTT